MDPPAKRMKMEEVDAMLTSLLTNSSCCKESAKLCTCVTITPTEENIKLHNVHLLPREKITVTLNQEPEEKVDLHFSLKKLNEISTADNECTEVDARLIAPCCVFVYNSELTFNNNIHELSQDYGYEIILKALINESNMIQHKVLTSHKAMRTSNTMVTSKMLYLPKYESVTLVHLCFSIRRFKSTGNCIERPMFLPDKTLHILLQLQRFDILLYVGNSTFKAHKCLLSWKSEDFKAMFSQDDLENIQCLKIEDYEPSVVEGMLDFMYSRRIKNLPHIVADLIKLAYQYTIHDLLRYCEEYYLFNICTENISQVFELANSCNSRSLTEMVVTYAKVHEDQIMRQSWFLQYLQANLNNKIVSILRLCAKYNEVKELATLRKNAYDLVKNTSDILNNREFLELFDSHPELMKDLFKYIYKSK